MFAYSIEKPARYWRCLSVCVGAGESVVWEF